MSPSAAARLHPIRLTPREALLFEAGIKLGGIFHQYLGTPVAPRTAAGLARTIERAVGLQPFVAEVRVRIDPTVGGPAGRGRFAYRYLTAEMLTARVSLVDGPVRVEAGLALDPRRRYPLMSVRSVATGRPRSGRARAR